MNVNSFWILEKEEIHYSVKKGLKKWDCLAKFKPPAGMEWLSRSKLLNVAGFHGFLDMRFTVTY